MRENCQCREPVSGFHHILRALLNQHVVRYWVESQAISINDGPETAVVNFGQSGDAARLQAILDEAE